MRFLLVAQTSRNLSFLSRLEKEGHETAILAPFDAEGRTVFHRPKDALDWAPDAVIFLEHGMGKLAAEMEKLGVPVFNGGIYQDTIAEDPDYASVLASRVRVPILPVDNGGIHFHVAGFFSKKAFVGPALSVSVDTGLLPGGSSQEAVTLHAIDSKSPIIQETFIKLEKLFTALKFSGIVFLDIQVDLETKVPHIHRLSVTAPDGFWAAFISGIDQDLSGIIKGLATGRKFNFKFTDEVSGAVKATLPPYPHTELPCETEEERELLSRLILRSSSGIHATHPAGQDVYWLDVKPNGTGTTYITTGPEVAYVSASGSLQDLPYVLGTAIDGLGIRGLQYRSSMGKELATSLAYFEDYKVL